MSEYNLDKHWPKRYAQDIFNGAPKKKFGPKIMTEHLNNAHIQGQTGIIETINNLIKSDPNIDLDLLRGELHIMMVEAMKRFRLNGNQKYVGTTSLEDILEQEAEESTKTNRDCKI